MVKQIVVLSGPVATGKSKLAQSLVDRFSFHHIRTRELLVRRTGVSVEGRRELQSAGAQLDAETGGEWVADELERDLRQQPQDVLVVIDAVRIQLQVEALYSAYGAKVVHVHLTAPPEELTRRYSERWRNRPGELSSYAELMTDQTEANIGTLERTADVVIDTVRSTPADIFVRASARLGLYGSDDARLVDVIVGGQYGSEGKGNIAHYLGREYSVLVRVGGPNAGHRVKSWSDQE